MGKSQKSLTSLTSLGQDWGNTCKLIPKSKPTFQKNSSEYFEFKKISQRAKILALRFRHFPGVLKNDAVGIPNCLLAPREALLGVFQVFWAVLSHFPAVSAPKIAETNKFMYFSDQPNVELEPRQNCQKGRYCEGSHDSPSSRGAAPSGPYYGAKYKSARAKYRCPSALTIFRLFMNFFSGHF